MADQTGTTRIDTNQFVFSVTYAKASLAFADGAGPDCFWEPGTDLFRLVLGEFYDPTVRIKFQPHGETGLLPLGAR